MHTTKYLVLFVIYREGLDMNTGKKNPITGDEDSSFNQLSVTSPLAFDSVKNKSSFSPLKDSNSFGTVDYVDQKNAKTEFSINLVFISMTIQEPSTLHHLCELERTHFLTLLAISVQNHQLAVHFSTGNRINFLDVKGCTVWLYDCPENLSLLYEGDKCFDCVQVYDQDTVLYIDPITRQTFKKDTLISSDINQQKIIALDLDKSRHYVLTHKPVLRATPLLF